MLKCFISFLVWTAKFDVVPEIREQVNAHLILFLCVFSQY